MAQTLAFSLGGIGSPCCCAGSPIIGIPCLPCNLPADDVTLSSTNILFRPGSTTLTFTPTPPRWFAGCVGGTAGLNYLLTCSGGNVLFTVTYFVSGVCPTGQHASCSNPNANGLTLTSFTCSPLSILFTVSNCLQVSAAG